MSLVSLLYPSLLGKRDLYRESVTAMTCLSDKNPASSVLPEMISRRLSIQETEKQSGSSNGGLFYGLKSAERVFPVYAMGILQPEVEVAAQVSNSSDPIWDAVRDEARVEV